MTFPPTHSQVAELVARWEESRESGRVISLDELCRDCPQFRHAVEERIKAIESLDPLIDAGIETGSRTGSTLHDLPSERLANKSVTARAHYSVIRPHAAGGLGEVVLGHDSLLNREVARLPACPRSKNAGDQIVSRLVHRRGRIR